MAVYLINVNTQTLFRLFFIAQHLMIQLKIDIKKSCDTDEKIKLGVRVIDEQGIGFLKVMNGFVKI